VLDRERPRLVVPALELAAVVVALAAEVAEADAVDRAARQ